MASGTGFHPDETGRKLGQEKRKLFPAQLLLENGFSVAVDTVKLEDVLGEIDSECGHFHGGPSGFPCA
jgi:hypothetical protein